MSDIQEFNEKCIDYIVKEALRLKKFYESELAAETNEARKEDLKQLIDSADKTVANSDEAKNIMIAFSSRAIVNRIINSQGHFRRQMDNSYIANSGIEGMVFSQAEDIINKYTNTKSDVQLLGYGVTSNELIQKIYEACGGTGILPTTEEIKVKEEEYKKSFENAIDSKEAEKLAEEIKLDKVSLGLDPKAPVEEDKKNVYFIPRVYRSDIQTISINELSKKALETGEIGFTQIRETEEVSQENLKDGDISLDD